MKYLAAMTFAALLATTSAHAENWQRVDTTHAGQIIEMDMDSIRHAKDGSSSAVVNEAKIYFDCNGHFGPLPNGVGSSHIPGGSIGESLAALACDTK